MCGGVQKVSRPMERCHEISHSTPIIADVTPRMDAHRYHGILVSAFAAIFIYTIPIPGLFQDFHSLCDCADNFDGAIENRRRVLGCDDGPDARLPLRHSRISDSS